MRQGAFGIIFDEDGRVLLAHRRNMDAWNLPGGLIEDGEAPWDAAIREEYEEVGVTAEVQRLVGLYWKPDSDDLVFAFACRAVAGTPGLSDEADEVGYFSPGALPPNTAPKHEERIRDAVVGGSAVLRVQTGPRMRDLFASRT